MNVIVLNNVRVSLETFADEVFFGNFSTDLSQPHNVARVLPTKSEEIVEGVSDKRFGGLSAAMRQSLHLFIAYFI